MKNHMTLALLTCTVVFCVVGCGSPPAPTEVSQPPTASPDPTATETPLPPTATLEPTASKTPKPTWTPVPFGTFVGCIYFEGNLVDGMLKFNNENGYINELTTQVGSSGCATLKLRPGYYEVHAGYWKRSCAVSTGCPSEWISFEMEPNGLIEMDIETFAVKK